jgi:hypothetical protein
MPASPCAIDSPLDRTDSSISTNEAGGWGGGRCDAKLMADTHGINKGGSVKSQTQPGTYYDIY